MQITEAEWTEELISELIRFSADWEREKSCWGYRKNTWEDLKEERVFLATENDMILGYLLGHAETEQRGCSVYPVGTRLFEVSELYVIPSERSKGIGKELMRAAEKAASEQADVMVLSTATKNAKAILHFYLDEVGMELYSARLFKRLS